MKIVFFGSTADSILVLEKVSNIVAVVTQPPKPIGRNKIITSTPVEVWAKTHNLPALTFPTQSGKPWKYEHEQTVINSLQTLNADLLVSASYGQKIPAETITAARLGGLNVHPSLLPRWRGGDPVPWAILSGDHQIGVTIVTLSPSFDDGKIIAQKKIPITEHDTSDPLRTKLFAMGAELLTQSMPDYLNGKNKGISQETEGQPYAKRFTREDGFEAWDALMDPDQSARINRKFRALHPWPGVWTIWNEKRVKILEFDAAPVLVQLEGKKPVSWEQFQKAYLSPSSR